MKNKYQIPFATEDSYGQRKGDMLSHAYHNSNAELRDNVPFKAEMKIIELTGGRSPRFILKNEHGNKFPMFMTEARKILLENLMDADGKIKGEWMGIKRGSKYGIKLVVRYYRYTCKIKNPNGGYFYWVYFEKATDGNRILNGVYRNYRTECKNVLVQLTQSDRTKSLIAYDDDLESVAVQLMDRQK